MNAKTLAGLLLYVIAIVGAQAQAPSIAISPQGQTVDYGSDATFSVIATGTEPLSYQWMKSSQNLADYENITGAHSSALHVVGAANRDEGDYTVVVFNLNGSVTSAPVQLTVNPTVVFQDSFESAQVNWQPFFKAGNMALNTNQNHTPNGRISMQMTDTSQAMYHNLGQKLTGMVRVSGWIYDGGSGETALIMVQGHEGAVGYTTYATGKALGQTIGIGICGSRIGNVSFADGQTRDSTLYQGYIFRGATRGWFNLDATNAPHRSVGWHSFALDRWHEGGKVDFWVDGVLGGSVSGVTMLDLDSILIGSTRPNQNNPQAVSDWFDDIQVLNFAQTFDSDSYSSVSRVFPDWMVFKEIGTNEAAEITGMANAAEVDGKTVTATAGGWSTNDPEIFANGIRGTLNYTITAPANDAYRIEIEGRETKYQMPEVELPLHVWVDGEYLGRFNLAYTAQSNGFVRCFSPYLLAGPHTISIFWDNAHPRRSLSIRAVRLQTVNGPLVSGSSLKKWVANRLVAESGIEVGLPYSLTSPACIEGRGQFLSMMSLTANQTNVPVFHGAGDRWYANVPLLTNQATPISVSYQNGGLIETNSVTWQPIDLLQGGEISIRQGDSLLFTALPSGQSNGSVTVRISGGTVLTTDAQTPVAHQFDSPGTFWAEGTIQPNQAKGHIKINVVGASLEATVPVNSVRDDWVCSNLPPAVVLDGDPRLNIVQLSAGEQSQLKPPLQPLGTNVQVYRVQHGGFEPRYVLARVGQNGPVLASAAVQGVRCALPPESSLRLLSTLSDGTESIEGTYVLTPVPTNVTVKINVLTAGVSFDDGTLTRTLQPTDFDGLGIYRAKFLRSEGLTGSVCIQPQIIYNDSVRGQ